MDTTPQATREHDPEAPAAAGAVAGTPARHGRGTGPGAPSGPLGFIVDPALDAQRRRDLRQMRLVATGLLVFAAIVYVLTRGHDDGILGFVNAGAEASMVGACADWFAVTAIFRHPLGLPIPHTALIPRKKEMIGRSLEEFVSENFMREDIIRERVLDAEPTRRARRVGPRAGPREATRRRGGHGHRPRTAPASPTRTSARSSSRPCSRVSRRSRSARWPVGCSTRWCATRRTSASSTSRSTRCAAGSSTTRTSSSRSSRSGRPAWVPDAINDLVARKIHVEALKWLADIRNDPRHDVRLALDKLLIDLADDLQHDPVTQAKAERLKERVLAHPQVADTAMSLWASFRAVVIAALDDDGGPVRARAVREVTALAERAARRRRAAARASTPASATRRSTPSTATAPS